MGINFNKAEFILSAVKQSTFIRDGRPQVAFAGRSNVGKSSVINRLLNRKNFARVGAAPEDCDPADWGLAVLAPECGVAPGRKVKAGIMLNKRGEERAK